MAAGQLNRERRALLGAALALPLVRHSGLDPSPAVSAAAPPRPSGRSPSPAKAGEEWHAALAAYLAAEAAVAGEEGRMAGASFAEAEAAQEGYDGLGTAMDEALPRLFAAAVPDVGALAVKLELFAAHEAPDLDQEGGALAAIAADARQLSLG